MKRALLVCFACLSLSACSCKDWGYCPHVFPNAERFAGNR